MWNALGSSKGTILISEALACDCIHSRLASRSCFTRYAPSTPRSAVADTDNTTLAQPLGPVIQITSHTTHPVTQVTSHNTQQITP